MLVIRVHEISQGRLLDQLKRRQLLIFRAIQPEQKSEDRGTIFFPSDVENCWLIISVSCKIRRDRLSCYRPCRPSNVFGIFSVSMLACFPISFNFVAKMFSCFMDSWILSSPYRQSLNIYLLLWMLSPQFSAHLLFGQEMGYTCLVVAKKIKICTENNAL